MITIDYVKHLAFPRAMGSQGEKKAQDLIQKNIDRSSINVHSESFQYSHGLSIVMRLMFVCALLSIVIFNLIANASPWFSLSAIMILAIPAGIIGKNLLAFKIPNWGEKQIGKNIVAEIPAKDSERKTILLTAHYDSISSRIPTSIYKILFMLLGANAFFIGIVILMANIGDLAGLSNDYVEMLDQFTRYASIPAFMLILILLINKKENKSHGACDNGTGIAILLRLLHIFSQSQSLKNSSFKCIFTGAEELGLWGSRAFIERHGTWLEQRKSSIYIINVDMVGSEIAYLDKIGLISKKPLNHELNKIIQRSSEKLDIEVRAFGSMLGSSSDFAPFLLEGFEVCTFTSMKDKQIHSGNDRIEYLSPERLEDAVHLLKEVILTIDAKEQ